MATTVQTSQVFVDSSAGMSLNLNVLPSILNTTLGKTSLTLDIPSSSQLTTISIPNTLLAVLDKNTSSATAISMDKSQVALNSDQSNILAVTSDKSVTLEVDSQKSTAIGADDQRTKAST
jgi:hypothetical protein